MRLSFLIGIVFLLRLDRAVLARCYWRGIRAFSVKLRSKKFFLPVLTPSALPLMMLLHKNFMRFRIFLVLMKRVQQLFLKTSILLLFMM